MIMLNLYNSDDIIVSINYHDKQYVPNPLYNWLYSALV